MMNETGSYPGQVWLWLYTFWYQIKPFSTSANADILVMAVMGVLSLAFVLIPFIPGVRRHPALDPDLQADLARALPVAWNLARRRTTAHQQPADVSGDLEILARVNHRCPGDAAGVMSQSAAAATLSSGSICTPRNPRPPAADARITGLFRRHRP